MNRYMDSAMRDRAPQRPWAMYLAGADDRFRFLAFDLDAHGDAAAPLRDLDVQAFLIEAGGDLLLGAAPPQRDGWTVETKDGRLSAQWEHTLLVTAGGCEVLTARRGEPWRAG